MSVDEAATRPDFSEGLHALREQELRRLPPGASTVLHGGASSTWYFEWFEENYPTRVERHICVEAFAARPAGLPRSVHWLQRTLGDMAPVPAAAVDLVFAGQVIEHLWAADVAGFLLESRRVLAPDGRLVVDSPNRRVTEAIRWHHPQHTTEYSVDEVAELVRLAGFEIEEVRGVLLGYDRERHRFLNLQDDQFTWERRAAEAPERPEDSFVWWLVARPAHEPDPGRVQARAEEFEAAFRAHRLGNLATPLPIQYRPHGQAFVSAFDGAQASLVHGPLIPVDRGAWRARFQLRLDAEGLDPEQMLGSIDVTSAAGVTQHARRQLAARDLRERIWTTVDLDFDLPAMVMGVELRAFTSGVAPLSVRLSVELGRPEELAERPSPSPTQLPEPRSVELLGMLQRRARARIARSVGSAHGQS